MDAAGTCPRGPTGCRRARRHRYRGDRHGRPVPWRSPPPSAVRLQNPCEAPEKGAEACRPSTCSPWNFPEFPHSSRGTIRSEEHTSELQSLMRISYAVFCLKKKKKITKRKQLT